MNRAHINITIDPHLLQEVKLREKNLSRLIENLLKIHLEYKDEIDVTHLEEDKVDSEMLKVKEKLLELEGKKKIIMLKRKKEEEEYNKEHPSIEDIIKRGVPYQDPI